MYKLIRKIIIALSCHILFRVKYENEEVLEKIDKCLICPNHSRVFDPMFLLPKVDNMYSMAKSELFKHKLVKSTESIGEEIKEALFEKEKTEETEPAADEAETEAPGDPSIAPLPAGCPMRDSDVKELAFDLLNVIAGVVEELFRDPDDKPAA